MHGPQAHASSQRPSDNPAPETVRYLPDDFLDTNELAIECKVSPRTVEGWRGAGTGPPFVKVGGRRVIYRWGDAYAWLMARVASSTSEQQAA